MMRSTILAGLVLVFLSLAGCHQANVSVPPDRSTEPPPELATRPARIEIKNARMPVDGILTGGQITQEQLEEAAAAGYRTVVNLRTLNEEGAWDEAPRAAELGLRFVHIPVAGAKGLTEENARRLNEVISDPQALPALVHCGSGNRVGALFALEAFHIDGADAKTALQRGREAGLTSLEEAVKEKLGQ